MSGAIDAGDRVEKHLQTCHLFNLFTAVTHHMDAAKIAALIASKKQAMKRIERAAGFNQGKNRIRLFAGWNPKNPEQFWRDFGQHFIKNAADELQAVYVCAAATDGKPCNTCNALRALIASAPDDTTTEVLAKSKSSKEHLVNALHLDSSEPNTPKVTKVAQQVLTQIFEMIIENGAEAVLDPEKGHEIVVNREGTGLNTRYTTTMSMKPGTPIPKAVQDKVTDLDDYVKQDSTEGEQRALAALNTVAGLLPAPGAAPATPTTALPRPAAAPIGARVNGNGAAGAARTAPDAGVALDAELDDLLGDIDTTA
jgi:hypothetical protein